MHHTSWVLIQEESLAQRFLSESESRRALKSLKLSSSSLRDATVTGSPEVGWVPISEFTNNIFNHVNMNYKYLTET